MKTTTLDSFQASLADTDDVQMENAELRDDPAEFDDEEEDDDQPPYQPNHDDTDPDYVSRG